MGIGSFQRQNGQQSTNGSSNCQDKWLVAHSDLLVRLWLQWLPRCGSVSLLRSLGRLETGTGSVGIFPAHGEGVAFGSLLRNSSSAPILTSQLRGRTLCVRGIAFHPGGSFCLLFWVRYERRKIASHT